jgi:hypothetical protein
VGGTRYYLHRLVISIMIGRMPRKDEHVHHVNGNRFDNRPSNLQLLTSREHTHLTNIQGPLVLYCPVCGRPFLRTIGNHPRKTCSPSHGAKFARRARAVA